MTIHLSRTFCTFKTPNIRSFAHSIRTCGFTYRDRHMLTRAHNVFAERMNCVTCPAVRDMADDAYLVQDLQLILCSYSATFSDKIEKIGHDLDIIAQSKNAIMTTDRSVGAPDSFKQV